MTVKDEPAVNVPSELERLDGYLNQSESRIPNIRSNCEKKIVWHQGLVRRRAFAIVYFHGFSASRMETWPLCDRLAQAIGANLFYTRLTGHGQDGSAMGTARVADWQTDALEALAIGRRIGEKIILIGTSTGGTLATWLAGQPELASRIHCLVLISPNFGPKNPVSMAALCPSVIRVFESFFGGWRSFSVTGADHAHYWTARYPIRAISTMMHLVKEAWQVDLGAATIPVLMLINPWDRVINVTLAVLRFSRFPGRQKRLVWFRENRDLGRHVLAGDILSPGCTSHVLTIIKSYLERLNASAKNHTSMGTRRNG